MKEIEERKCSCGCGAKIRRRYFNKNHPKSYVRGHQFRGPLNVNWNGGRYQSSARGYIFIRKPDHPNADHRGYVTEHVLAMSNHLDRPIQKNEVVHHINGIPDDNRIENLICMTRSKHHSLHHKGLLKPNSLRNLKLMTSERGKEIWRKGTRHRPGSRPKICDNCGTSFFRKGNPQYKRTFCSKKCYWASLRKS